MRDSAFDDFNGDGYPDFVLGDVNPDRLRLPAASQIRLQLAISMAMASRIWPVTEYFSKTVQILLGQGNGTFVQGASVPAGSESSGLTLADFNGDGKLDLVVANRNDGTLTVALGNGNGTFGTPSTIALGSGTTPQDVVAADFNQDGKLDLAVAETGANQLAVLLGNGNGTFTLQPKPITAGSQPWVIALGDFNNDGKPDFAAPNSGSSNATVALNAPSTSATATLTGVTLSGTRNQSVEAKYAGSTVDAASTSNLLSLPPM